MITRERIFITGSSGFIGNALARDLLHSGFTVAGLDNHNDYYDVSLKVYRDSMLKTYDRYTFFKGELTDFQFLKNSLEEFKPDIIINLAAQAGVRFALLNPNAYIESNIIGFHNILEACKELNIYNIIFASSSSVYGDSREIPFQESNCTDSPLSLYAASKKTNELFAFNHANNFPSKLIGLRFFTVYGPCGRPDMAYYSFSKKIHAGQEITLFNEGKMSRDMTYISDIIDGIKGAMAHLMEMNAHSFEVFNLGNRDPVELLHLIQIIEEHFQKKAIINHQSASTEVLKTFADITKSQQYLNFNPKTNIHDGMRYFFEWFEQYSK